jgi:hypothetical protein
MDRFSGASADHLAVRAPSASLLPHKHYTHLRGICCQPS